MGVIGDVAVVEFRGDRREVRPGEPLSFGRSPACTICLDPDDRGISRRAGSIGYAEGGWLVTNTSETRPIAVVDPFGFRTVLAPGRRAAVDRRLSVVVEGQILRHELVVTAPGARPAALGPTDATDASGPDDDELETEVGADIVYRDDDRLALVAMFAGYLRPFPRHDPRPRPYAKAAEQLGWPRRTLVKRIEYVRTRLVRAGIPNLQGERALEGLAEHVIATGVIGPDDLVLLERRDERRDEGQD